MSRAFLIVLDSFGIGGAPDAAKFGDEGSNTALHIAQRCADGAADVNREGPLNVPFLDGLGLGRSIELASGEVAPGLNAHVTGRFGAATEISMGKDTPSGHWELAGVPVPWDWHYFPDDVPSIPSSILDRVAEICGSDGVLGGGHASGTKIIEDLGVEHIKSGRPIVYTSADSVLQICAHEEAFGLERLLATCKAIAPEMHKMKVGRVIARPFVGTNPLDFKRTTNRKDFAIEPPVPTLIDYAANAGRPVHSIGKIWDIFSGRGLADAVKGSDAKLMDALIEKAKTAEAGSFTFANFVEFDTNYGHPRDVAGYARALEWFDTRVQEFVAGLGSGDLAIFTADHGNDPTWSGTDHTRERVPVLVYGAGVGEIGHIGFSDVGASIAAHLGISYDGAGTSFL